MFSLRVTVPIYPTESEEKVRRAVQNIFDIPLTRQDDHLSGESTEERSLDILEERLRYQKIRDTARAVLRHSIYGTTLKFCINKQTAFVGVVNFIDEAKLGVIHVEIESDNIQDLIDRIAPSTVEEDF